MTDLNPELIAKAADAIDYRRHDFGVDPDTWRTYCICGWSAERSHDVAAYDRHLAVTVLEAVADDLRAEGGWETVATDSAEIGRIPVAVAYDEGVLVAPVEEEPAGPPVIRHRDAITGQYVDADEAAARPETTVRETRKP